MKIKIYSYCRPAGRKELFARTFRKTVELATKEKNKVVSDLLDNKYNWQNPMELEVKDREAFEELEGAGSALGFWVSPLDAEEKKQADLDRRESHARWY
jgi:hypothetical protein